MQTVENFYSDYSKYSEQLGKLGISRDKADSDISNFQATFNKNKKDLENRIKGTWTASFIHFVHNYKIIQGLFAPLLRKFKWYRQEEEAQNLIERANLLLKEQIRSKKEEHRGIVNEILALKKENIRFEKASEPKFVYQLIISLFGGKEKFEQLPVLDISKKLEDINQIEDITTDDMSHPIMRFKDQYERPGLAIRARIENSNEVRVQTIYQFYPNRGTWMTGGQVILPYMTVLDNGRILTKPFQALKELIQQGKTEVVNKGIKESFILV